MLGSRLELLRGHLIGADAARIQHAATRHLTESLGEELGVEQITLQHLPAGILTEYIGNLGYLDLMTQFDHESVFVEGDLVDYHIVARRDSGEEISQGEIEGPTAAGGDDVGRQCTSNLFDEDAVPRRHLEGGCRVLVEIIRQSIRDRSAEAIDIGQKRPEVATHARQHRDSVQDVEHLGAQFV